jgi:hypothetical protein
LSDRRRGRQRVTCFAALLVFQLHQRSHPAEIFTTGLPVNELGSRLQERPVDRMCLRRCGNAIENEWTTPGRDQEPATSKWTEMARNLVLRQSKNCDQFADAEIWRSREEAQNTKSCLISEKPQKLRAVRRQSERGGICTVAHANLWRAAYGRRLHLSTAKSVPAAESMTRRGSPTGVGADAARPFGIAPSR